jgi:hypothetical protein
MALYRTCAVSVLLAACVFRVAAAGEPRFVAFSLGEACRLLAAGQDSPPLGTLGGMTRVGATVYDPAAKDVILIGLAAPSIPTARWDDLVVTLRARILHGEFPLVSIEPTPDTPRTKRQNVRFCEGLKDTSLGEDLLACDVFLKRCSLELDPSARVPGVPSYRSLIAQAVGAEAEREGAKILRLRWSSGKTDRPYHGTPAANPRAYQARFWYVRQEPYVALAKPGESRPEIFRIDELALMVESRRVEGAETKANQDCRERFAKQCTERLQQACAACEPLKNLKMFYDLAAVADAIDTLRKQEELPFLDYLLRGYRVADAKTRRDYPLEEITGVAERSDGGIDLIYVSGGIALRPEIRILNGGSVVGLRKLVLGSRPSPRALAWEPPLAGWRMPNAKELLVSPEGSDAAPAAGAAPAPPGCFLSAQSVTLRPAAGGGAAFHGFSAPHLQPEPLGGMRTYKWNGVLIDPNVVRDPTPLPKDLRSKVLDKRTGKKKPAWEVDIPPLPIEDERFQKGAQK